MKLCRGILTLALTVSVFTGLLNSQTFSSPYSLREGPSGINPTSIAFGPDQRLYLLDVTGDIYVMSVQRIEEDLPIRFDVVDTDTISLVRNIPNHNDDGTHHVEVKRQATGIYLTGSVSNPVIYVTSSDYRIKNIGGPQTFLDTNSGVISRLTWNGSTWEKVDLVRGLPRSEENHATNGLVLDTTQNTLYIAQGGNTNAGGPGFLLGSVSEYALSASILTIDLDVIDTMPVLTDSVSGQKYVYDIPTVDDPRRGNHNGINDPMALGYDGRDINDPFGGNDGLNQARWIEGGPVQVYSSGYRNPYDVLYSTKGHLFSWDNGPNNSWGGAPIDEGLGTATNEQTGLGGTVYNFDGLHRIDSAGYYAGHPNPIRCNPDSAGLLVGTSFLTSYNAIDSTQSLPYDWPPVDSTLRDPQQGIYIPATQPGDQSLCTVSQSTNGIAEYTATNFDTVMTGDIIATGFANSVFRAHMDSSGQFCDSVTVLFSGPTYMLDVICQGDDDPFPGTIWIARHISSSTGISIYEPQDFSGCVGGDFANIDEDEDGYTNADEIDNGTDPCNGADSPANKDFDKTILNGFLVSDLNDPDDDDDGIVDSLDYFVWDASNGQNTSLPINYPLLNNNPGTGFFGLGFTGLMSNGTDDYLELIKSEDNSTTEIVAGGASGVISLIGVDTGDATGSLNTQANGFQFGFPIDSTSEPVMVRVTGIGPVFPDTIQDNQSVGAFIGTGDQDNYVKLAITSVSQTPKLQLVIEENGSTTTTNYDITGIDTALTVDFFFVINPANGMVFPYYSLNDTIGIAVGTGVQTSGALLLTIKGPNAMATGIIATAIGSTNQFEATWDYFVVRNSPELNGVSRPGDWIVQNLGGGSCTPGQCATARHECAYVESGDKFYLIGGREASSLVEVYDPTTELWTEGAVPPGGSLHHFQAVDYHGLIIAAGAFRGSFPNEESIDSFYIYDPIADKWYEGPELPVGRVRGSSAASIDSDRLFLTGGNTMGHNDGSVAWSDQYDFTTGSWTILPDAPNRRDHYHSVIHDDQLYAAAGRRTGSIGTYDDMEATVDVLNIQMASWDTLPAPIPTTRAGAAAVILNNDLVVMGGERDQLVTSSKTEAYSLIDSTWRTLDDMTSTRHGFQAIENNGNIYINGGATVSSFETNREERYEPYGQTTPILTPTIASTLTVDDTIFFAPTFMLDSSTANLIVSNTAGNQALLISRLQITDSLYFVLDSTIALPRLLKPGASISIPLRFRPNTFGTFTDTLTIMHSGVNAPESHVLLNSEGRFNWIGGQRFFVDSSATTLPQYGTSWDSAVTSLSMAFDAADEFTNIREIWIAKGTYTPGDTRESSFSISDSLTVLGGFSGIETMASERNAELNPVVLSGDIGVLGDSLDNVYHVVKLPESVDNAFIDGVTISHGQADGAASEDQFGAGIQNLGKATLSSVTISRCVSVAAGSAIHSSGANAVLRLAMVSLIDNSDPFLVNKSGSTIRWIGTGILR